MTDMNLIQYPYKANYLPVKQNGRHLLCGQNFTYKLCRKNIETKKTYFVCSLKKTKKCTAAAVVDAKTDMIIRIINNHNHDSSLMEQKVRKLERETLKQAGSSLEKPRDIVGGLMNKIARDHKEPGLGEMRKKKTIKRAIQRERKARLDVPKEPTNWEEVNVPDSLKITKTGQRFLQATEIIESRNQAQKILIFSSDAQLSTLKETSTWLADGTFECVKHTLFYQLFVLTGKTKTNITVPLVFALLPNKETATYAKVFEFIQSKGIPPPSKFYSDFESAISKGFKLYYPNVEICGCDAHFKRSLRREITTKLKIGTFYNKCPEFQTLVRLVWALALVPCDQIVNVWENYIVPKVREFQPSFEDYLDEIDNFLIYVESTWIGALNPRTGIRKRPTFSHSMWNKHTTVMDDGFSTTNSCEGYNKAFGLTVNSRSGLWSVISQLQTEEVDCMKKVAESMRGPQNNDATASTSRNNARDARRAELKSIVSNYNNVNREVFMSNIISYHNYDIIE